MLKSIKLIGIVLLSVLLLTNCKKENVTVDKGQGEVTFSPNKTSNFDKSEGFNCDLTVSYARAVVDGITYDLPVFYIDGIMTTQAIKLDVGEYELEEFILMNDNETPEIKDDDLIVMASVNEQGEFAPYVDMTLPYEFDVEGFIKVELYVEVICYYAEYFEWYGFEFFTVHRVDIHEKFFFGDLCLLEPYMYEGSLYEDQTEGLQADVPAIFYIDVYRNSDFLGTFTNVTYLGEGEPLKVTYADRIGIPDLYEFNLKVLVKVEDGFDFVFFNKWIFTDIADMDTGEDNVTDFVIGNCVYDGIDYTFPQWYIDPGN